MFQMGKMYLLRSPAQFWLIQLVVGSLGLSSHVGLYDP